MEIEKKGRSDILPNGNPTKRGRGRPRGSVKKKMMSVNEVIHNARTSRRVDFFSPDTVLKSKVKKRGRPKKIKIPGRPRKIPLTPEEEAERILRLSKQRKRRISKPLGRPRIHPLEDIPKVKRGRGRPRKYEPVTRTFSENSTVNGNLKKGLKEIPEFSEDTPRKRGRPRGSFKKKRGRPAGSCPTKGAIEWNPGKRGRPPGSGTKLNIKEEANGIPRKRGRPPGSGTKIKVRQDTNGSPRKRGRPPGTGTKVKIAKQETDGIPRKRGRPPGSGTKVKVAPQESNGAPRKRGRPPGSGKSKVDVKDTDDSDFSSSALYARDQPRKRGRPSKASLTEAFSVSEAGMDQNEVNDCFSAKRARTSFVSSKNSNEEVELVAENEKACENDAGREVAVVDASPLPAGGSIVVREARKQAMIEKNGGGEKPMEEAFQEVFVTGHGSRSRKCASSRVTRKSQKKM